MKYRVIENTYNNLNALQTVMTNRGMSLTEIEEYFYTDENCLIDGQKLDNMNKGIDLLLHHFKQGNKIFLQADCDPDGWTSSALFLNYIQELNPEWRELITYRIHEGKEHGFILDSILDKGYSLAIAIDASSNQFEEHKILVENGIDVLVLDHHETTHYSEYATVINNQLSEQYNNKALCGVGVAYKFCKEIDNRFGTVIADNYLDLVALGHVADMMDMRQKEINFLTYAGIGHIRNPLFSGLVNKQSFSLGEEITRTGLSFYVVPLINAVIRVGTQEEKETVFKSMLEEDAYKLIPSTKRGCKGQLETNLEQALRICTNCHSRQKKLRVESADTLISKIENEKLNDNKIIIVEADDSIHKNLIGLVAMELVSRYKKPVLLVRAKELDNEQVLQGSGRNYDRGDLKDLKGFLEESKMFKYAEGHSSAFGACLPTANLNSFIDYANTNLANISFDPSYEVDILYKGNDVSYSDIMNLGSMKWLWGKGIEEPLIAIENLVVTPKNIQLLSPDKKPTLKITLPNGITVMKFRSSQEEYEKLVPNKDGYTTINLVGSCHINNFKGNKTPQIFIEDYEILNTIDYLF